MCGSLREQRRDVQLLYSSVLREGRREWGQGRFTVTKEKRGAGVIIFCHFLVNYCYFTSWNNIINIVPSRRALFSHEYLLRQRHPASEKKKEERFPLKHNMGPWSQLLPQIGDERKEKDEENSYMKLCYAVC